MINNAGMEPNYLFGFLRKNTKPHMSSIIEIMELITELTPDQREGLKTFLLALK